MLVRATLAEQITFLAASIAYYALVSLLPLLLLVLVAASLVGGDAVASQVVTAFSDVLSETGASLLREALTGGEGRTGATLAGVGVLLWTALKVFRGLDIAFSRVYGTAGPDSLLEQLVDAVVALGAVGIAVAISAAAGIAIAWSGVGFTGLLATPALVVALALALLPLYYLLPDRPVTLREALPGAAFAAAGWVALGTIFRVYAANAGTYEAYGVIGAVLLLVTLLYFGGIVLLLGTVLNAVLAGRIDGGDTGPDSELRERLLREDTETLQEEPSAHD